MHYLVGSVLDRRLQLVERLTSLAAPNSIQDLARALNTSVRTLANDVLVINRTWTPVEITMTGDLLSIAYRPGFNLHDVYRMILKREPIFRLLRALILYPETPTSELTKLATMSEASLYRNIKIFNTSFFPQLGISIASNPFHLEGERTHVLLFSSIFLCKQTHIDNWPFKDYPRQEVEEFLSRILDSVHMVIHFSEFRMLCFYVVLSMIWAKTFRKTEDFTIAPPLDKNLTHSRAQEVTDIPPNLQAIVDKVKHFETVFSFPMTRTSLLYLFSLFFRKGFCLSYRSFLDQAGADPEINKSFFYLIKVLYELQKTYGIKPKNRHEILRDLHNTLYCQYMEPDMAPFFTMNDDHFHAWLSRNVTGLPLDLKDKIRGYFIHMNLPVVETLVDSCIFYLFMKWGRLIYRQPSPTEPISLLILSSISKEHAQTLREIVEMQTYLPLRIDIFEGPRFNGPKLLHAGYDIVWSNFSISDCENDANDLPWAKEASELVLYTLYPNQKDMLALRRAIMAKAKTHEEGYFV